MEMATYILSILKCDIIKLFSWGAHNFTAIQDGLEFSVQGFIFTGQVRVVYEAGSDTFKIQLVRAGELVKEETDIYLDNLTDVIDGLVEKNCSQEEYEKKVNAQYSIG